MQIGEFVFTFSNVVELTAIGNPTAKRRIAAGKPLGDKHRHQHAWRAIAPQRYSEEFYSLWRFALCVLSGQLHRVPKNQAPKLLAVTLSNLNRF